MRVFVVPIVIATLSACGLIAALLGEGWHDLVAWMGLGVPVGAVVGAMTVRRH